MQQMLDINGRELYEECHLLDALDCADMDEARSKYDIDAILGYGTEMDHETSNRLWRDDIEPEDFWDFVLAHTIGADSAKVAWSDGSTVDLEAAANLMDDDIRERLHSELAPCTPQEFFDAYCKEHQERFGERFEV